MNHSKNVLACYLSVKTYIGRVGLKLLESAAEQVRNRERERRGEREREREREDLVLNQVKVKM